MESEGIVDGGDVFEMDCVGYFETFHAVGVAPLLKMHLEGSSAPVAVISTDLTFVFDTKSVQFIEPVRDRFAIPAKW